MLSAVMGVLIIGGLGLLGYGVYSKLGGSGKDDAPAAADVVSPAAPPAAASLRTATPEATATQLGALGLDQPAGSRIADANAQGNLLTLRIEGGGLNDRVAVVDLAAGRVLGWVHVDAPGAAAAQ